jgi:hypothetical protein
VSSPEPSSFFQLVLFISGVSLLAFGLIWGWFHGMWRVIGTAIALAGGAASGWFLGPLLALRVQDRFSSWSETLVQIGSVAIMASLAWLILEMISRMIFPKTRRVEGLLSSMTVGIGGGILGMLLCATLIYGLLFGFRQLDAYAVTQLEIQDEAGIEGGTLTRVAASIYLINRSTAFADRILPPIGEARVLANEEESAEGTESLPDPLPKILAVSYALAADPMKLESFFSREDVIEKMQGPLLQEYLESSPVVNAIERQRFDSLIWMKETRDLLKEPEVRRFVRDFQW